MKFSPNTIVSVFLLVWATSIIGTWAIEFPLPPGEFYWHYDLSQSRDMEHRFRNPFLPGYGLLLETLATIGGWEDIRAIHAYGLVVNMVCGVVNGMLTFLILIRYGAPRWTAAATVFLICLAPIPNHFMSLTHPLMPFLTLFYATLLLSTIRPGHAYVPAAGIALFRAEGLLLVGSLVLRDLLFIRDWRAIMRGATCAIAPLYWYLSPALVGKTHYVFVMLERYQGRQAGLLYVWEVLLTVSDPVRKSFLTALPIHPAGVLAGATLMWGLIFFGGWRFVRHANVYLWAPFGFFVCAYSVIHVLHYDAYAKYVIPLLWMAYYFCMCLACELCG